MIFTIAAVKQVKTLNSLYIKAKTDIDCIEIFIQIKMEQPKWNYVEYIVYDDSNSSELALNTDLSDEQFHHLMSKMSRAPYKYFGKQCKVYYNGSYVYENHDQKEIKTYSKTAIDYQVDKARSIVKVFYAKDKIPFHTFPASTKMNAVSCIKKITFRVHNRIYINFQFEKLDGSPNYRKKVYINYNHDANLDAAYMDDLLDRSVRELCG